MVSPDRPLWGGASLEVVTLAAAVAVLALAAVLARPADRGDPLLPQPALRAIALDVSASATTLRRGWPRQTGRFLRDQCRLAEEQEQEILLVEYALGARRLYGPGPPALLRSRLDGRDTLIVPGASAREAPGVAQGSNLAMALQVLDPYLSEQARLGRLLVIRSDGTATGNDPARALGTLARAGVQVEWSDLGPPDLSRLAILAVHLPRRAGEDAPLAARLDLLWQPGGSLASTVEPGLDWVLSGPGGDEHGSLDLDLPRDGVPGPDGILRWTVRLDLPARSRGAHHLQVMVAGGVGIGAAQSSVGDDQRAGAWVSVGDAPRVAVVRRKGSAPPAPSWTSALSRSLDLREVTPDQVLAILPEVDVLFTLDVGPVQLPGPALISFVEGGGGWLAAVGWTFLGSWTRADQALPDDPCRLLPLDPGLDGDRDRDVVLLVDGSGSMFGEPFERVRRALFQLVPAALPSDRLELRFFSEMLGPVVFRSTAQTPEQRRRELAPLLQAKLPDGGTDILYSLSQLAESRTDSDAPGLVLLLSDGRSAAASGRGGARVRAQLTSSQLDLRILVIGDNPDRGCLPSLLGPGETMVETGDLSSLAELLHLEVNRRRVSSGAGQWALPAEPATRMGQDILAAQVAESEVRQLLQVPTFAHAEWVTGADRMWVVGAKGQPLLALHPVGRGAVAALATQPGAGWAPDLAADPALLIPLLTALAQGSESERDGPRLQARTDQLHLEEVPLDWPELVGCEFWPPRGPLFRVETEPMAVVPLHVGTGGTDLDPRRRRSGSVPHQVTALPRGSLLEARLMGAGGVLASIPFLTPGPDEWSGAARIIPRDLPAPVPSGPLRRPSPHPAAPWVLALGLVLGLMAGLVGGLTPGRRA